MCIVSTKKNNFNCLTHHLKFYTNDYLEDKNEQCQERFVFQTSNRLCEGKGWYEKRPCQPQ